MRTLKSWYKDDFGGGFNFNYQRGPGFTPMEVGPSTRESILHTSLLSHHDRLSLHLKSVLIKPFTTSQKKKRNKEKMHLRVFTPF